MGGTVQSRPEYDTCILRAGGRGASEIELNTQSPGRARAQRWGSQSQRPERGSQRTVNIDCMCVWAYTVMK
jgi:hypothetical protein